MSKPFLESYEGQTIQQLIALKESHRIDSLVLAVEQALGDKPMTELSEPERVVLAIEAMEREVNNGGYHQFFINSSREYTGFLVRALELIDCPKTAAISADAIAVLQLPAVPDADAIERAALGLSEDGVDKLGECDSRYFETGESIEESLFAYIERNQDEIQIPHAA
jgi:hypothetical protein